MISTSGISGTTKTSFLGVEYIVSMNNRLNSMSQVSAQSITQHNREFPGGINKWQ